MEVKIYRESENEQLLISEQELQEYNRLVVNLNLSNKAEEEIPPVYVPLNSSMVKLLKALCPCEVNLKDYNNSTIPVEVLKVAEFAIENKMFEGLFIWYADKTPDPLLVGWNYRSEDDKKNGYTWAKNHQLIARWGDCAMELDELLKKGFESLKISLVDSAKEVLSYTEAVLKNPDTYVRKHLKSNLNPPNIDISGATDFGELPF